MLFRSYFLYAERAAEISNLLRFKMRYLKKYIGVLYNLLVCVTGGSLLMMIIWLLLQIFVFASFAIPSDSMEPVLIPGDYVLVNKMLKGPRIFSLGDARQHKPLHIDRLKGFSEFQRNEVLVFNFPYPDRKSVV